MIISYSEDIYKREIDKTITFYKARLYLKDSEFKILSDIAKDAEKMITFLEDKKEDLITEMTLKNIDSGTTQIRGLVLNKARYSEIGFG